VSETAQLLDAVRAYLRRYVVLSDVQADAEALWTLHTHAFPAAEATAYLDINSAEKESGKTRNLEALELVVAKAWLTGRVTAAVLVRKVAAETPTLLLDESDAVFNGDKEYAETLRGVLNTGYRRGGKASVCVGQGANIGYRDLSTFAPKAIAGIGKLPDTVASRSIPIRLKRRAPDEPVERFRRREALEYAEPLHQWLTSWAEFSVERLEFVATEIPGSLRDRAGDVWEPLLAIADMAGGEWPTRARAAAVALSGETAAGDDSIGVRLLAETRAAFGERDRLSTEELIGRLCEDEEAPWSTWHKGARMSPRSLSGLLRRFDIGSRTIRLDGSETAKGYLREQFEDAWRRYLPAHPTDLSVTTSQPAPHAGSEALSIRNTTPLVTDTEPPANPHEYSDVTHVTAESAVDGSGRPEEDTSEADYWAERIESLHEQGEL
jgi:hypothetical protein